MIKPDKAAPPAAIPFHRPFIGKEEEDAVLRVLRSGWLTTASETLAFEKEFAEFLMGADAPLVALAVNSATSGLHLALEACGVRQGDVVIVPTYTFTATAEVARYLGAEVAFVDCAKGSFNIDQAALEKTVTRLKNGLTAYENGGPAGRPAAIIPVHFGGIPCNMAPVMDIAREHGLAVIEDAAHSFPSKLESGVYAGAIGDAGVFSFYATKTMTTGEGGMVVTQNPKIASRISVMRCHGIDRAVWNRYTSGKASWYYEVIAPGFKYNMTDIAAALGRQQLKRAGMLLSERKKIAALYDRAFGKNPCFILPPHDPANSYHLYPLRINPANCGVSRNQIIEKLQADKIGVSVHFIPLHTMPYYKKRYNLKDDDFPAALENFLNVISLPMWPGMTNEQIEKVIDSVLKASVLKSAKGNN
ncbi:spore coat protein [Spirochaetia bacterium]|nr:spore coat protein [Spirochaetia bacterium]